MSQTSENPRVLELRQLVDRLSAELEQARGTVRQWTDASTQLARSAAEARAKNQLRGRGVGGVLLGASYRAAARREAARSNARIAEEVAERRSKIAAGKLQARDLVSSLRAQLSAAKKELADLLHVQRVSERARAKKTKETTELLSLLQKLQEAHQLNLLTDEEYDRKRRELVAEHEV